MLVLCFASPKHGSCLFPCWGSGATVNCKLPPAPFPLEVPALLPGIPASFLRDSVRSFPPSSAAAGRYPELRVPVPDWVPFGSPGRSRAWPRYPRGAGTGGHLRLGRDELPAMARGLSVLSKLRDGRGRAGTDGDIRALLGPLGFPLLGGRRGRRGLGFYGGPAAAGFGALDPRVLG